MFFPFFVEESKSINMNFLLPTLHDSFNLEQQIERLLDYLSNCSRKWGIYIIIAAEETVDRGPEGYYPPK